jgi:hypothetical protein
MREKVDDDCRLLGPSWASPVGPACGGSRSRSGDFRASMKVFFTLVTNGQYRYGA